MKNNYQGKNKFIFKSILFIMLTLTNSLIANEYVEFYSRAFDLSSGKLLYVEKHKETWKDGVQFASEVRYVNPSGKLVAYKNLDYSKNKTKPDFEYTDNRSGYMEGAKFDSNKLHLKFKESPDEEVQTTNILGNENLVVDAGFDNFVKQNWHKLSSGNELQINFAVPERLNYYRFTINKTGTIEKNGIKLLQLRIVPTSKILRLLTSGINLEYSIENHRLMAYEGITNVSDDFGKKYKARIIFEYPNGWLTNAQRF